MAFVTIDDIKPYILPSIYNTLNKAISKDEETESTNFDLIEPQAAILITELSGVSEEDTSLDWIIIPAAWVIQKLASNIATEISADASIRIEGNYQEALKRLQSHPSTTASVPPDRSSSFIGTINNLNGRF